MHMASYLNNSITSVTVEFHKKYSDSDTYITRIYPITPGFDHDEIKS